MPNIGPMEIAIVLIIALVVFGPKKLPELGKSVGTGFREFKDGVSGVTDDVNVKSDKPEVTATAAPAAPAEPVKEPASAGAPSEAV